MKAEEKDAALSYSTSIIQQSDLHTPLCLLPVFSSRPSHLSSVHVSVSGFQRSAAWASTESFLLDVVVEARQNEDAALWFAFGRFAQRSLLLYGHDAFHQACDGCVDVGVVLHREREKDDGGCERERKLLLNIDKLNK